MVIQPKTDPINSAQGDSGFTIAEAVIAAALMAMVFCALLYTFLSARHGTLSATNNMMAMSEAREEMETIISQPYTNILSFAETNITSGPLAGLSATKTCTVATNIADCKQVDLQIRWRNQASGSNSLITLTTLVSDN
ncbi:MAG: hypothetical protein HY343_08285 [Lentisphaerae bacterium]|nr:hypothetical protein [Lentisphaerota bacterium]